MLNVDFFEKALLMLMQQEVIFKVNKTHQGMLSGSVVHQKPVQHPPRSCPNQAASY